MTVAMGWVGLEHVPLVCVVRGWRFFLSLFLLFAHVTRWRRWQWNGLGLSIYPGTCHAQFEFVSLLMLAAVFVGCTAECICFSLRCTIRMYAIPHTAGSTPTYTLVVNLFGGRGGLAVAPNVEHPTRTSILTRTLGVTCVPML